MDLLLAFALGYLLGAVPFGLILTRLGGAGDVRDIGSGSTGATNVLRTGRKGLAAATVLLDLAKGVAAVLIAARLWPESEIAAGIAGIGAIVGHCFPVWIEFRGGKGVATAAGACLALAWPVMLVCAGLWALTLALSRISSLASLVAIGAAPLVAVLFGLDTVALVLIAIAAIVVVQHRGNIARLRAGTEPKVGSKPA